MVLDVRCDISDEESVKRMVREVEAKFGPAVHVLENNAAAIVFHTVETASVADWERSCATNIVGNATVTRHCLPLLKRAGGKENRPNGKKY